VLLGRTTFAVGGLERSRDARTCSADSRIDFVRDKSEWDGTDIVFEITSKRHPSGDKTEIRFTHVGLVPTIECYDGCSGAWGFYVNESLRSFIAKGKGQPNLDERRPGPAKSRGRAARAPLAEVKR